MISASILFGIYILVTVTLTIGYLAIPTRRLYNGSESVSVIVTTSDEQKNISECILALEKLSFPKNKLEVILIDDGSSGDSKQIVRQAIERNKHFKLASTDAYLGHLDATRRAIHCGAQKATGDWLFITDTGSYVSEKWIETMLAGSASNTGAISGPVNVISGKLEGILVNQTYAYTSPAGFGFGQLFSSFFCLRSNIAIRKSAYDKLGGLEKIPFKVAEEIALFLSVKKHGYETLYQTNKNCLVNMLPVQSLDRVQTHLHRMIGGFLEQEFWVKFLITNWLGLLFNTSVILFFGWLWLPLKYLTVFWSIKILSDLFTYLAYGYRVKAKESLKYLPLFLLLNPIVFFYLPLSYVLNRNINRKGSSDKANF